MGDNCERLRLVFLGLSQTGKSAVIRRFISRTFIDRYKPTVEELYYREFDLGHIKLKVDIMDTAGDFAFPAMRRLAIASAHAFVLMYSVENAESFEVAKQCFEEIREERKDYTDVPMVFVGNKSDLADRREVLKEDVCEWVFCELPKMRAKVLECSAKDDSNIKEIFRTLLQLSKYPSSANPAGGEADEAGSKLIRRSSAYVSNRSSSSSGSSRYSFIRRMSTTSENNAESSPTAGNGNKSSSSSTGFGNSGLHSPLTYSSSSATASGTSSSSVGAAGEQPAKPRSRSLIRRCSRKAKQQMRDAQVDNCAVS